MENVDAAQAAVFLFWISLAVLAVTYLGYPLFLFFADFPRRRSARHEDFHEPFVSLVIPARNEAAHIGAKVRNALALDYPHDKIEIIVVDDRSADGTAERARHAAGGDSRVRVVRLDEPGGKARALNLGVEHAAGEIVVFSDADSAIDLSGLRYLVRPFGDSGVGCVGGRYLPGGVTGRHASGVGLYWRYENYIRSKESRTGGILGASGALFAVRRSLFEPLPPDLINDDFVIPMRISMRGYRSLYEPRATAVEDESRNQALEFGRRVRIMAGNCQHLWLFRGVFLRPRSWLTALQLAWHKGLRVLSPLFLLAALGANVFVVAFRPDARLYEVLLVGQGVFHAMGFVGRFFAVRGPLGRLAGLCYYFLMINTAALCGLCYFISGRRGLRWNSSGTAGLSSSSRKAADSRS